MPVLQFKGKSAVESYHLVVPHHTIEFDKELSLSGEPSLDDNLIIEGDNLLALKALLPTHGGKIKCVYIDPPYNTGNEGWVYNDNLTQPQFKEWIGQVVGKEGEDLCRHDKWCCMMYPRLCLLKELLSDDGVILISIDDFEVSHLRMVMDELFGNDNFIAQLVWEKGRKNDAKLFSVGHEYMLVYAKSRAELRVKKTVWRETKPGASEIWSKYLELQNQFADDFEKIESGLKVWFAELPPKHPSKRLSRYKHVDSNGPWRDDNISWPGGGGPTYDVTHPITKLPCRVPERGWIYSTPEKMQLMIDVGVIEFRADHSDPPFRKSHLRPLSSELLDDDEALVNEEDDADDSEMAVQVMPSVIYKQSQVAVKQLRALMGAKVFENPKDPEILQRLFNYVTGGDKNAIFLDSFAGSGTTAHAVIDCNRADGGNRRFVLAQIKHDTKKDEIDGKNIAQKVTRERVVKVIGPESVGLSYARLGKPLFDRFHGFKEGEEPAFEELARYIFYTETSSAFDPKQIDEKTGFIGKHGRTSYYLLYNANRTEDLPLTRGWLETTMKADPGQKVIYAERLLVRPRDLTEFNAKARQVPFNLR